MLDQHRQEQTAFNRVEWNGMAGRSFLRASISRWMFPCVAALSRTSKKMNRYIKRRPPPPWSSKSLLTTVNDNYKETEPSSNKANEEMAKSSTKAHCKHEEEDNHCSNGNSSHHCHFQSKRGSLDTICHSSSCCCSSAIECAFDALALKKRLLGQFTILCTAPFLWIRVDASCLVIMVLESQGPFKQVGRVYVGM